MGIGGAEKLLTELLPVQRHQGHEVVVLRLATGEFEFVKRLEKNNIPVISIGKNENDIYNPFLIFKLAKYVNKFDIVHVHLFPCQYWVIFSALYSHSKSILVTTEHSTDNRRRSIPGFKWIDKFIYRHYNKIIAISNKTAETLANYLGSSERICVINNGINLSTIIEANAIKKEDFGCPKLSKILLQVARFSEQKDQETLIRSLKYLPNNYHAVFVGDGTRRVICENIVQNEGVEDRVHFLGMRNDVPSLLKAADVIVMSSHFEGFGLAAVEGMAAKKPVIASDIPGLSEVVKGAGLLFEHSNSKMLSEKIISLFENDSFYNEIANKCFLRAQQYNIQTMAKSYEEIYLSLYNSNR